jgi:phage I-like protein
VVGRLPKLADMATRTAHSSIAALTLDVTAGSEIQLLPAGEFRAGDGRPQGIKAWRCNAAIAQALITHAAARQTRFVIDYEHQTLLSEKNGQPAPAAGWFRQLEWRDGQGLFATDVEWTDKARAMIGSGEYRYISPVFSFHPTTGAVLKIQHAGLTNVPALDGMAEVVAAASRFFEPDQLTDEEIHMTLLSKLLAAIGLQETATEAEALSTVVALKAKADQASGLEVQVAALKTATPDPEKYVPVETMKALQTDVAALTAKLNGQELDGVIDAALKAGKLLPSQEVWARELGGKDLASLKTYVETAPAVVPTKPQTDGKAPGGDGDKTLSAEEQAVCKQLGITAEAYLKTKAAA